MDNWTAKDIGDLITLIVIAAITVRLGIIAWRGY